MKTTNEDTRVPETDEEFLFFNVSDEELERAHPGDGVGQSVLTLVFGTFIAGNCACPV